MAVNYEEKCIMEQAPGRNDATQNIVWYGSTRPIKSRRVSTLDVYYLLKS